MTEKQNDAGGDHGIDLLFMLRAVRRAMQATRIVQASTKLDSLDKSDKSPVTIADWAAQAVVAIELTPVLAKTPLVGEEEASVLRAPESAPLLAQVIDAVSRALGRPVKRQECLTAIDAGRGAPNKEAFFTLDPVDGTKGFLRGGQYAVSLALIDDGAVVAGVLGCPNLGENFLRPFDQPDPEGTRFYATAGGGAFSLAATAAVTTARQIQIVTDRPQRALRMCESVESGHSRLDSAYQIRQDLGVTVAPARLDSQCKYAVVARGQADVYLRLPTRSDYVEKIWDHAAGALIATEAGAQVTDIDGRALDFSHGTGLSANRGIVCADPAIHPRLLEAIAAL